MWWLGKQCVIETHSEHLVNRLRLRSARGEGGSVVEAITLYFVEVGDRGTEFHRVDVNQYGVITNWPRGFFDQAQSEAEDILSAGLEKRRAGREAGT
jgi:predicted ATPase